jgi:hypothetical protein
MSGVHRQIGLVSHVDVGCAVWSTTRRRATSTDEIPVGGLVVAVTEHADPDAGEINRAFLVFDHETTKPRIHWARLPEADIDRTLIEALDLTTLRRAVKSLCNDVVYERPYHRRTGMPSPTEVVTVRAIATLMAVITGDDTRDDCQKALDPNAMAREWRRLIEAILESPGPITADVARRAFAAEELVALVFGDGGLLADQLAAPDTPAEPAAPRPSARPNISALVD